MAPAVTTDIVNNMPPHLSPLPPWGGEMLANQYRRKPPRPLRERAGWGVSRNTTSMRQAQPPLSQTRTKLELRHGDRSPVVASGGTDVGLEWAGPGWTASVSGSPRGGSPDRAAGRWFRSTAEPRQAPPVRG